MKKYKIVVLKGDGIGPEICDEAILVLNTIASIRGFKVEYIYHLIGGASIDKFDVPIRQAVIKDCLCCDGVLLGAVGGAKWDYLPLDKRPEKALLNLRKALGVFANLRLINTYEPLLMCSNLKDEAIRGVNFLIVRELLSGIYFGTPRGFHTQRAFNTMAYTKDEIESIARVAFKMARLRRKKVCSVDKANVLEVSRLWREVVFEVSKEFKDVVLTNMYVDNVAMQIILNPREFDVILTGNLFGDILSDEAAAISSSIGLLPSASISKGVCLFEPIHGSAIDIAGKGIANPISAILSVAMLLQYSLNDIKGHDIIEQAIKDVLSLGYRTRDIMKNQSVDKNMICSTKQMGALIADKILKNSKEEF